jgi:hypothetical protein
MTAGNQKAPPPTCGGQAEGGRYKSRLILGS